MKNIILLLFVATLSINSFAQKIKFKNEIATVDGTPYVKWIKQSMGNEVSISSLSSDEEEIFMTYQGYKDPNQITNGNPEGSVKWVELNFLTLGKKCEIPPRMHKGVVKYLLANKIYVDGVLNEKNVDKLILKYGTKYSDDKPNKNINIIINNK